MYPKKERVAAHLSSAINEMRLLLKMSERIETPDDYLTTLSGMIVYRACGMSLQYVTESMVKIRSLCGSELFRHYPTIPWSSVFGMRNFLSHEYGEVDAEGIFGTVKRDIPILLSVTEQMLADVNGNKMKHLLENDGSCG